MLALPAPLTTEESTDLYLLYAEKNRRLDGELDRLLEQPASRELAEALQLNTLRFTLNLSHMAGLRWGVVP